jgi:hypothetical protein
MIYIGLDDTDTLDTPGTNKLALHLAERLAGRYDAHWIVRHQLLVDPRVPCTNKNGCASMVLDPRTDQPRTDLVADLFAELGHIVIEWSPAGSDPGLCVAERVGDAVQAWGRRAQAELLRQADALALAHAAGVFLEPLGGTGDGVIGALAAVGLQATQNSGRVIHRRLPGDAGRHSFELAGPCTAESIYAHGVDDIVDLATGAAIAHGTIDLGKRLRPNLRGGRVVLYAARGEAEAPAPWIAQRVVE